MVFYDKEEMDSGIMDSGIMGGSLGRLCRLCMCGRRQPGADELRNGSRIGNFLFRG